MLTKNIFRLLAFYLVIPVIGNAQYDNVWVFGDSAGLDFSIGNPQPIKTRISTSEGSASFCNESGELLFYTDGTKVWNKNHQIMPNGNELVPLPAQTISTAQAALIVPIPGHTDYYYIFSLTSAEAGGGSSLYYSMIDMTLDSRRGDVVVATKGKLLDRALGEQMTAASDDNCGIWILNVSRDVGELRARNISFNGLDTLPVISSKTIKEGFWIFGSLSCMDISPDRKKLAIAQGHLVLYDFDAGTGRISNEILLQKGGNHYGVSFSPDNTKLYASNNFIADVNHGVGIYQFDLSAGDSTDIRHSKVQLTTVGAGAVKRGPDGKIYIAASSSSLHVIHKPNLSGLNCNYEPYALSLLPGTTSRLGFPTTYVIEKKQFYSSQIDTIFCADSFLLTASRASGTEHTWEDGTLGESRQVYHSDTYWVRYKLWNQKCEVHIDTFHVTIYNIPKHYSTITFTGKCQADTFTMTASNLNETNYIWEDDTTTGPTRKINKTGIYWVRYQNDSSCEHYVDTFIVTYPEQDFEVSFRSDTIVCVNDAILFQNTSDPHFNNFTWSFGNGDSSLLEHPQYTYTEPGNYEVRLIGKIDYICSDTTYTTIVVDPILFSHFVKAPDSICVGESITFSHAIQSNTINNLKWQFGDGMELWSKDNSIQHAYDIDGIMPVTLSAEFRACPNSSFTDTIYVFGLPKVDLGADSTICLNGAPLYLKNMHPKAKGIFHYLWNTGAETEILKVNHPGTYTLTVSSYPMGCSNTESVEITKDCYTDIPNAFTPNGDGINDYFFPRQLLSKNITRFNMQILNRWGQVVFETNSVDGRGWDGKFNGKEQPADVYIYLINIEIKNERNERYKGNVTLVR